MRGTEAKEYLFLLDALVIKVRVQSELMASRMNREDYQEL